MNERTESVGYRFAMLYRLNMSFCSERVKKFGLTMSQVPFIAELLLSESALTQDQLSVRLEIDKAATARALEHLEKRGLVGRKVNPDNRRQKLVYPTESAIGMRDELFGVLRETSEIFARGFTPEEKRLTLDLMDRMMENARNEKYGSSKTEKTE